MFGGGKPIPECTDAEIRALLIGGTTIAAAIGVGSFWSGQPAWFLWPLQLFCVGWLAILWCQALWELRSRKRATASPSSDEQNGQCD